jgi:hypothetical protein
MTSQRSSGVGKPGFQFTFEPSFIEGAHLVRRGKVFEFLHEGLSSDFLCSQAFEDLAPGLIWYAASVILLA